MKKIYFFLFITIYFSIRVCAGESLEIRDAWARENVAIGGNSALFMKVINASAVPYRLIKAETEAAEVVELHTHIKEGDIYRMRPVPFMEIPAGKELILKTGDLHIMLIKLKKEIREGQKLSIRLIFEGQDGQIINYDMVAPIQKMMPCSCH